MEASMFEISAISKDGHNYTVKLSSTTKNVVDTFTNHIIEIGWEHHNYTITQYKSI